MKTIYIVRHAADVGPRVWRKLAAFDTYSEALQYIKLQRQQSKDDFEIESEIATD